MSEALTKRQRSVLRVIEAHQAAGGPAPSLREIGEELGLKNVSAVAKHVTALNRKGAIEATAGKARSLRPISPLAKLRSRTVDIPVLGAIPAGFPEQGEAEAEGCVSVDIASVGFTPTRNTFAVRVRGVSMIGRHILDGDIVILERGPDPRHGQVVAALVDGERTLKTYVIKNGKPYLKAENPKYPDLIPAQELVIQGVFKALIRKAKD
jgi:repressor LexA